MGLSRSFTSVHELLPTYRCYNDGDGNLKRVDAIDIPYLDRAKAAEALHFHREIADAVEGHLADESYIEGRYALGRIIEVKQPTSQSGVREGDRVTLLNALGGDDPGADGTVPRPSATTLEYETDAGAAFSAERHASLQNDDHVLLQLTAVGTGSAINWSQHRFAAPMIDLALDIEDLANSLEPVLVRALPDHEPRDGLMAVAVDVQTGEERARQPLVPREEGWHEAEPGPLPEGLYRTYGASSVEPVTELVTVLAP